MSARKRLCFLSRTPLDQAPYAELLLPSLARDGWQITVVAPRVADSVVREQLPYPCVTHDLPTPGAGRLAAEFALSKKLIAAKFGSYEVVYLNSQSLSARGAWLALGPKLGQRLVYHNSDYYCPVAHPARAYLEGVLARRADLVLNGEFHRGYISRAQYRITCPVVVAPPNLPRAWPIPPCSNALRAKMSGGRADAFVLMLHGGLSPLRMVPELFAALARLPDRFRLVMTAAAQSRGECDALLQQHRVADRVLQLPRGAFRDLLKHTVNADVGVLLYKNNDLGNFFTAPGRLTEYLACSLPVLASRHTGLQNLVQELEIGRCVDSRDPDRIAAGLLEMERDRATAKYSARVLREKFENHLALDHWEPHICQAFNDLLEDVPRVRPAPPPDPWIPGIA